MLPVKRSAHDAAEPVRHREQRDDQFGRVAEGGVEEAADTGAGVLGDVLGCLPDQPGERHQRDGGENEEERLRGSRRGVERDHERAQREPQPEDAASHSRTLHS